MKVVPEMLFFTFSNADIQFEEKELTRRNYTTKDALSTTCRVEFINNRKFAKAALDENFEVFLVHGALLTSEMTIHLARKAQIALLLAKKVTVSTKYTDFVDVFSKESAKVLPERTGINEHAIQLGEGKQPPYGPIYSLSPVEL